MKKLLVFICLGLAVFASPAFSTENFQSVDAPRSEFIEGPFKAQVAKKAREERCLTEAIYYEAANQSQIGKEAVALVVLNRVMAPGRPKTICGVVSQAHIVKERKICQFSFWCEEKRKPVKDVWQESMRIAHRVIQNYWNPDVLSYYSGAMYYHATYVRPKWRTQKQFLGRTGDHLFYSNPDLTSSHR